MKNNNGDSMASILPVAYIGFGIAVVFVLVSVISIVAEIRHSRYALLSEGRSAVKQAVPYVASLPCRDEQERVYVAASRWVDACDRDGVPTWIIGDTRTASLDVGVLYPWARTVTFGYASAVTRTPESNAVRVTRTTAPPRVLEPCSIGILKKTQRVPVRSVLKSKALEVTCARRDWLDRFRFPMRRQDVFTSFIKADH